MISFPPAKINLGLQVLRKRTDGYHDLSTCMVEIPLTDILEIVPANVFEFTQSGREAGDGENLCVRAWKLMQKELGIPPVHMHLHKIIPMGAGLGGGSSDATYVLRMLNKVFSMGLTSGKLKELASRLGSDCAFFVDGGAQLASGRGDVLDPVSLKLPPWIAVINPGIHISTAMAYATVSPRENVPPLNELLARPVAEWKYCLQNDFQAGAVASFPLIGNLVDQLYHAGAVYAAMSGSGSTVFGLFDEKPALDGIPANCFTAVLPLAEHNPVNLGVSG